VLDGINIKEISERIHSMFLMSEEDIEQGIISPNNSSKIKAIALDNFDST
jgi:hypothetical protein